MDISHVLVVDDSQFELVRMEHYLSDLNDCTITFKKNSHDAIKWCNSHNVDLVLVDYQMPLMDGLQFIETFRAIEGKRDVPLIMFTSSDSAELCIQALKKGANDFIIKPVGHGELLARVRDKLALRKKQIAADSMIIKLNEEVDTTSKVVTAREIEIVNRLAIAAEYRDEETGLHIARMAHYCRLIARHLGLSPEQQNMIFQASPLHDVGKLGIADVILLKPGKLTVEEFAVMKNHTIIGGKILHNSHSPLIQMARSIALSHHEKFDGSGYPFGLAGDDIPLSGRITTVADVFDALTSKRPYKEPWPLEDAIDYLDKNCGSFFDPRCIDAFMSELDCVEAIYKEEFVYSSESKSESEEESQTA